jgi:hypothetical protein
MRVREGQATVGASGSRGCVVDDFAGPVNSDHERWEMVMRRWLGWFALAVIIGMQAGTVFKPLGSIGPTRTADWMDLLTPFAVLGCAAMVLQRAGADHGHWVLLGVGGIMFALGKGLHISANSVSNVDDLGLANASIVHLWDEKASHYVWYTGLFLVLMALALALRRKRFRVGLSGIAVSLLFAITLVNTYIEGGTSWLGIGFLLAGLGAALRWRPGSVAQLLFFTAGIGLVLLLGWGVYWYAYDRTVFPQFSELGWI